MSEEQPKDELSKDMAKKLVDMIAEVEREEAESVTKKPEESKSK